ncbi:MAG: hypothetical protein LBB12_00530 [Holosporaceae bacterium]|jgi:hypothetical protein|nr:hypothetical protein [Holosporaceae bacterium]
MNFCIFGLLLLAVDLKADTLDSYLNDILKIKKAYDIIAPNEVHQSSKKQSSWEGHSFKSNAQKSSSHQKSKKNSREVSSIDVCTISRERLFSDDRIETARLSPLGDRIAYIAKSNDTYSVYVSKIDGERSFEKIIRDISHIEDVEFIGKNKLVYVYKDNNKEVQLMLVDLDTTDRFTIKFDTKADAIQIRKKGCIPEFIAVLRKGNRYTTYKVNAASVSVEKMKDNLEVPPVAYYDDNLNPLLEYNNFSNYRADVFVRGDLLGGNNRRATEKIDTINDIRTEKYISINDSCAYKLVESSNKIEIQSKDLEKNVRDVEDSCVISQSPEVKIEHCQVNLDGNGKPIFVHISKGRSKNIALFTSIRDHIDFINDKFSRSDWQRVDMSVDGEIWLICVTNPQMPDRYFIYESDTQRLSQVAVSNKKVNDSIPLQKTECVSIRSKNSNEDLRGFLTKSVNHNQRRPLMIMVGADRNAKSKWNFNPHAQLMANRGCSVLIVDPRIRRSTKGDEGMRSDEDNEDNGGNGGSRSVRSEVNDIMDAVNWCIRNKICLAGNICLYAKDNNCIPTLMAFEKNQGIFSGCILLPGDDLKRDGILSYVDNINDIANPVMVINEEANSKRDDDSLRSNHMRDAPISYFVYDDRLGGLERASLIELFMSTFYDVRQERVSSSDIRYFKTLLDANDVKRSLNSNNTHQSNSNSKNYSKNYSNSRRHGRRDDDYGR